MATRIISIVLLVVLARVGIAAGDERQVQALPQHLEKILHWLPTDTETLIVANPAPDGRKLVYPPSLAASPLLEPLDDLMKPHPVAWAVHGGRNFQFVSAFGTVRQEGVSVIRLVDDLPATALTEIRQMLEVESQQRLQIAGQKVYVFPFPHAGSDRKIEPWQAKLVVILNDHTIIKASSRPYLKEFLERMESQASDRALPASLPEWKHVDFRSELWLLRRLPDDAGRPHPLHGIVWNKKQDALSVVYLPSSLTPVDYFAQRPWIDQESKQIPDQIAELLQFKTEKDGTVTLTFADDRAAMIEQLGDSPLKMKFVMTLGMFPYTSQALR